MAAAERGVRWGMGLNPRRVLIVAAIFIIAYFVVSMVGNSFARYELDQEQQRLRAEIVSLEEQQRQLDALRAYMHSDEFIERAARDQGLVRPGDISVVVVAPTPAGARAAPAGRPWWARYFGVEPQ